MHPHLLRRRRRLRIPQHIDDLRLGHQPAGVQCQQPEQRPGHGARTDSSTPPRRTTSGPNTPTDNTSAAGAPSTAVNRRSDDSRGRTAPRSMARTDRTLNPERLASSSCVHPSRCR